MVKTSTLFFIYNNNSKNKLYLPDELLEPGGIEDKIVKEYFEGFTYKPGEKVLEKILQAAKM